MVIIRFTLGKQLYMLAGKTSVDMPYEVKVNR